MTPKERASRHRWEITQRRKHKFYHANSYLKLQKILNAPVILDIYGSDVENSLLFINRLKNYQENEIQKITINFRKCKTLKAAALVMIFSIVERLIVDYGKRISLILPTPMKAPNVIKTLRKSGLLELCTSNNPIMRFNKDYLPIISSFGGKFRDEIVDFIVKKIYKQITPSLENIYADAIQEAINNVTAHAYLDKNSDIPKRWWLLCEVIGDQLFLVIYDDGIGIPRSLEIYLNNKEFDFTQYENKQALKECYENFPELQHVSFEYLCSQLENMEFPNEIPDHVKIYLAMIGDITRKTGKDELKHGQGSKSIKALVSSNENGILWLFSGLGRVKFINETEQPNLFCLPEYLNGTLIQWNIKVST